MVPAPAAPGGPNKRELIVLFYSSSKCKQVEGERERINGSENDRQIAITKKCESRNEHKNLPEKKKQSSVITYIGGEEPIQQERDK